MTAFAQPEELASFLQRDVDTATAELLLDMASDAIREDVDQQIDRVDGDQVTLDPPVRSSALLLPELPVADVTSLTVAGVVLVDGVDYTWGPAGIIRRFGTALTAGDLTIDGWTWGSAAQSIDVTYSHGYAVGSRQLKTCRTVCLQAAARAYVNPDQVLSASTTIGQTSKSRTYGGNSTTGRIELTEYERRQLDRLRDSCS